MIKASIIVTILSLVGSLMGFLVQMLMATHYGTGVEVDAYLYAIGSPSFLSGMVAALFSYTLVPKIAKINHSDKQQKQLLTSVLFLGFAIVIMLVLSSPVWVRLQKNALPSNSAILNLEYINRLLILGWFISGAQILLSLSGAILIGFKKPIIATLLNLGPYFGMLFSITIIYNSEILNLAYGLLLGNSVSFAIGFYLFRKNIALNFQTVAWSEIKHILKQAPYTLIGMSCFSIYAVIDSYWAPRAGVGVLASLGYSQRLMIAIGNLAVAGPSAVFAPKLSEFIVQNRKKEFDTLLYSVLIGTVVIVSILAAVLCLEGESIINLLFKRGAFDQSDVIKVAEVLKYCLPGMICMLLTVTCFRVIFCFNNMEKKVS